jgi:mannose-6-phosphate isomerase-like protein (cupin superfamily)
LREAAHTARGDTSGQRIPVEITSDLVRIGGFGTRYLVDGVAVADAYALIEHTLEPKLLGAPPHRHAREDEVSYVVSGMLAVWRAGKITVGGPGTVITKPRDEWHTFWNPGDEPVRFLELISPPVFSAYFRELGAQLRETGQPDPPRIVALAAKYGLEFDFETMWKIVAEHGLRAG